MEKTFIVVAIIATVLCTTLAEQNSISSLSWLKKELNQLTDSIISCGPYQADACNCVKYARDRQPGLPYGLTSCQDKKNNVNSHSPAPGCVLFRTGDPNYCHAAFVTNVQGGTVYIEQANWTSCKCSSDTINASSSAILGYWCPKHGNNLKIAEQ